jgi:hypothetical protein
MAIVRPEIPQPVTQLEDKIAVSALIKKFTFHRPISQSSKEIILDIVKKKKHTSPLKQSDRFITRTDLVRHMKRDYYYYYYTSISACSPGAGTDNIHVCAPL